MMRVPKWLLFALALVAGLGAAYAFLLYAGWGIFIGDVIGQVGREHEIAMAQRESSVALLFGIVLQFGVAGALFGVLDREDDHGVPIVWAVLGSLVMTFVCGNVLLRALRFFH